MQNGMNVVRIFVDKIASATKNVELRKEARCQREIIAEEGYIVAGRIVGDKVVYNTLEDLHGRQVPLQKGDVIIGVLGHRDALHGYSGYVPEKIKAGDILNVLNLGGVIGKCTSYNPEVGPPFDIEIIGAVQVFPEFEVRFGTPAHIGMNAIDVSSPKNHNVPVIVIAGTCMNSGKTLAASRLIKQLSRAGFDVGACKLTGVSLLRDTLSMRDFGARVSVTFTEAGIVTTSRTNAPAAARGLISHLAQQGVDVIVAELGDGLLGSYGVGEILSDDEFMKHAHTTLLCANDPVGVWGGAQLMKDRFRRELHIISGPATDNAAGTGYITNELGLEAINARKEEERLGAYVADRLKAKAPKRKKVQTAK